MYSGHFIKRGRAQLYWSHNVRDEQIMKMIQMNGHNAYCNYTATYNDFAPTHLLGFSSVGDCIIHAEQLIKEFKILDDVDTYTKDRVELSQKL